MRPMNDKEQIIYDKINRLTVEYTQKKEVQDKKRHRFEEIENQIKLLNAEKHRLQDKFFHNNTAYSLDSMLVQIGELLIQIKNLNKK